MKKKQIFCIISVFIMSLIPLSLVYAVEFNEPVINDIARGNIVIEGTIGDGKNNRNAVLYITKKTDGAVASEYYYLDQKSVDKTGSFKFDFDFFEDTDVYLVTVKDGNEKETKEFVYTAPDEIRQFLIDLCDNKITDLLSAVTPYKEIFDIDISPYNSERNIGIINNRVKQNINEIRTNIDKLNYGLLSEVFKKAKAEIIALETVENSLTWTSVDGVITSEENPLNADKTEYEKLAPISKEMVCKSLLGRTYVDSEDFVSALSTSIIKYKDVSGGNTGGGSSGSSSGKNNASGKGGAAPVSSPVQLSEPSKVDNEFKDIENHIWAKTAIAYLKEKMIVAGDENGNFNPDEYITREQFAKMISIAFELKTTSKPQFFSDVEQDAWYNPYVTTCFENGVITGMGNNIFGVGENITRQDIAVMIYRASLKDGWVYDNRKDDFEDFSDISDYASEAIGCLSHEEVLTGYEDNRFCPLGTATRAEAAVMLYRILIRR